MDALRHADAVLAALHSRHPECVLPGHVGSPMDDRVTLVLSRDFIAACEPDSIDADHARRVRSARDPRQAKAS